MTPLLGTGCWRGSRKVPHRDAGQTAGAAFPFRHAAINGWYYLSAPSPRSIPLLLLQALVESRGRMVPIMWNALIRVNNDPVGAERTVLRRLAYEWRNELLPRYRRLVTSAQERVESATPDELVGIVDEVGTTAGEYLFSLAIVGGSAWKMEAALARFFRRHLAGQADFGHQVLLRGLQGVEAGTPPHAVQSVDWYRPTLGELGLAGEDTKAQGAPARDRGRAGSGRSGVPRHPRRQATATRAVRRPSGGGPAVRYAPASSRRATSPWDGHCCAAARCALRRGARRRRGRSTTAPTSSSSPARS